MDIMVKNTKFGVSPHKRNNLPEGCVPVVDQADYFSEEKLQHLRKRTLDIGNETIRNIEGELDNYTIGFIFK